MKTENLDVSKLPDYGFGHRTLGWWGTMGFIAVEGTIFAVLIATYLYGIGREPEWPPGVEPPALLWGSINTVIILASCWPNQLNKRAAIRQDARASQRWLVVAVLFGAAFLAMRGLEFTTLNVRWDTNFYGSIVWVLLGFHTLHMLADFIEAVVLMGIAFRKPLTGHRFSDFEDDAVYWYFVVVVWLPIFFLIYILPRLL